MPSSYKLAGELMFKEIEYWEKTLEPEIDDDEEMRTYTHTHGQMINRGVGEG